MDFLKKILRIFFIIIIAIFIILMIFFAVNSYWGFHGGISMIELIFIGVIFLIIAGYFYYLNKYKY